MISKTLNNRIIQKFIFKTLCGLEIPSWINRLAYLTTFVPFIERIIPKEWISPLAVQHTVENQLQDNRNTNTNNNRPATATASNDNNTNTGSIQTTASSFFKSLEKLISKN